MFGPGDYFQAGFVYAEGATQYASNTPTAALVKQGGTFGQSFIDDAAFSGIAAAPGFFELTTAWSVMASYEHFWTPSLRTSVYGSYFEVTRPDNFNTALCATTTLTDRGASAAGRAGGCDQDLSYYNIGTRSQWNVTNGLYVGLDVMYAKLNSAKFNAAGTNTAAAGNGVAAGTYQPPNQDTWSAAWRIHRDIVP